MQGVEEMSIDQPSEKLICDVERRVAQAHVTLWQITNELRYDEEHNPDGMSERQPMRQVWERLREDICDIVIRIHRQQEIMRNRERVNAKVAELGGTVDYSMPVHSGTGGRTEFPSEENARVFYQWMLGEGGWTEKYVYEPFIQKSKERVFAWVMFCDRSDYD
jgi:hypothetical protein